MEVDAYFIAERYIGQKEVFGKLDNPLILAMLRLDNDWPKNDETPWCSAFMNWVCWHLRVARSKSLMARSWLNVGYAIDIKSAEVGWDLVILKRGGGAQPGAHVINAPGHVGFFAGVENTNVLLLGGNQGDSVSIRRYPQNRILGVRRIRT